MIRWYRGIYGVQVGSWRIYLCRPFQVWQGDVLRWQWKAGWKP